MLTDNWIVADSEDEDALRPLQIADQSGLLSGTPFSTGPEKILQPSTIQTASNVSLFTPPPGYQDSEKPYPSPLLPRGRGTPVPKSKPRPRPVPQKSRTTSSASAISAISASTLASDSIRPPTTPSAVSDLIEEVDPVFSIADRAKTPTRKTQVKKPTYVPPQKRQKSQDKSVKRSPNQSNHLPEDKDSRDDSPKNSETIVIPEISKKIPPKSVAAQPKQTPSVTLQSRTFNKPKSTPMSELIRCVNAQPNSPF
ncbi:hypothetical protein EV424DRAFT_1647888 [Suillus variegatus]|nr:hypothetical protein EV424DRAFT_1647888 [Suillus variegatus]